MNIRSLRISSIFCVSLCLILAFLSIPDIALSQDDKGILEEIEEEESEEYGGYYGEDEGFYLDYEIIGFIELENMVNTYTEQEPKDANKKNEIRNNTKFVFTGESLSFKMITNMYVNANIVHQFTGDDNESDKPLSEITIDDLEEKKESEFINGDYVYADDFQIARNLRISDKSYEITFRELFMSYGGDVFRLRIGNQIYGWGTADSINPTAYFNPSDARELIFKDEDEAKMSVPSVSLLFFMGTGSLELVYAPLHVPAAYAPKGNFWSTNYENLPFPVIIDEPEALEFKPFNYAYGGRLMFYFMGIDMSISGYHGPDPEPIARPVSLTMDTETVPNQPVGLLMKTEYHISNYLGIDFSTTFNKFVVQFEAAYSPDKIGAELPEGMKFDELREISDPAEYEILLPFFLTRSQYISYSAGLNYFVPINRIIEGHAGESVLIVEWHDAKYFGYMKSAKYKFKKRQDIIQPQMANVLLTGFRDSYFSSRLNVTVGVVFDIEYKSQVFMPRLGWDFMNGFTIDATYAHFRDPNRKEDEMPGSLFGFFVDKDVVVVQMRYRY